MDGVCTGNLLTNKVLLGRSSLLGAGCSQTGCPNSAQGQCALQRQDVQWQGHHRQYAYKRDVHRLDIRHPEL